MNDFDRFLESSLRRMLDPVVTTHPPSRALRREASQPILAVEPMKPAPLVVEPVPVAVAVTPLPPL